jgi:hypothetical protein
MFDRSKNTNKTQIKTNNKNLLSRIYTATGNSSKNTCLLYFDAAYSEKGKAFIMVSVFGISLNM